MKTLLKIALAATAVTAAFGVIGAHAVRPEFSQLSVRFDALDKLPLDTVQSVVRRFAEPLQAQFAPEPNDPPTGTGGSGVR